MCYGYKEIKCWNETFLKAEDVYKNTVRELISPKVKKAHTLY